MPGRLTVCPTPIGNLEDLSPRAARALEEADLVACEDTRRAGRLYERLELQRPRLVSYHEQNEAERARQLVAQIERGADVVFQAAGNSGLGVFDAAEESSTIDEGRPGSIKYAIGVDSNQNWVKPGFILTSMVKRVDVAVYNTVKELVEGRFNGGIHLFGLDNDGLGYALDEYNEKAIPPAVLEAVERARQDIIAGRIKVTDAMAK